MKRMQIFGLLNKDMDLIEKSCTAAFKAMMVC